ncbi:hypothetical protein [Micromonospora sp. LOL_024]|uniref:hypothetical protein n=1 Tax=Micromonospora sp. LOL_024 TaxID=3345412 RepID=UPI003A881387
MAEQKMRRAMTLNELVDLPVSFDLMPACRAHGIGRTLGYELAKRGEFPCRVLKIGNAYRVTRADLLRSLGLDPMTAKPAEPVAA